MNFFTILIIVIVAIAILNVLYKKFKEQNLINQIQRLYWKLNDIVLSLYKFKECPMCESSIVNIRRITTSGKSIEYSCEDCGEVMTCRIIKGKDPVKALLIQNKIKVKLQQLNLLIGDKIHKRDIDIAFDIN